MRLGEGGPGLSRLLKPVDRGAADVLFAEPGAIPGYRLDPGDRQAKFFGLPADFDLPLQESCRETMLPDGVDRFLAIVQKPDFVVTGDYKHEFSPGQGRSQAYPGVS